MKITHIIYDSIGNPWLKGGGATRTFEIYSRLSKHHKIEILCGNYPNAPTELKGIIYKRIGLINNYPLSRISFLIGIYLYIFFIKTDILIEDVGFPFPLVLTNLIKKCIASVQFIPDKTYVLKRNIVGLIVKLSFTQGLKFYSEFIAVSDYSKNYIKKNVKNAQINVIPNGINLTSYSPKKGRYLLFIGRIDIVGKGLDILINAYSDLVNEGYSQQLIIAGSGEKKELQKLKHLIGNRNLKDKILITNFVTGNKKSETFNDCLIVIQPSRSETFSITTLEAMSFGKPVIASNIGGQAELINKSGAGLLFESEDKKDLVNKIKLLTTKPELAIALGRKGIIFSKNFTWDKIAMEYENYLIKFYKQ